MTQYLHFQLVVYSLKSFRRNLIIQMQCGHHFVPILQTQILVCVVKITYLVFDKLQKVIFHPKNLFTIKRNAIDFLGLCPLILEYKNITQLIELVDYSQDTWFASPPSQISLMNQLKQRNSTARAELSVTFDRVAGGSVPFKSTSSPIDGIKLVKLLNMANFGGAVDANSSVYISKLFPQAIHLFPKEGAPAQVV